MYPEVISDGVNANQTGYVTEPRQTYDGPALSGQFSPAPMPPTQKLSAPPPLDTPAAPPAPAPTPKEESIEALEARLAVARAKAATAAAKSRQIADATPVTHTEWNDLKDQINDSFSEMVNLFSELRTEIDHILERMAQFNSRSGQKL